MGGGIAGSGGPLSGCQSPGFKGSWGHTPIACPACAFPFLSSSLHVRAYTLLWSACTFPSCVPISPGSQHIWLRRDHYALALQGQPHL